MSASEEPPAFFVPACAEEKQEQVYAELAAWCKHPPAAPNERVYSILWIHDGDAWTATVGQRLSGERVRQRKRRGADVEVHQPLKDGATVWAIFAPAPYMVVTDAAPFNRRVQTFWANPFMAGEPTHVRHFTQRAG